MKPLVGDAQFYNQTALPNGANTVTSAKFDLGITPNADFVDVSAELVIDLPAQATGVLGDATTISCDVYTSPDDNTYTAIAKSVLVQTGAGGAGSAAVEGRFKLPSNTARYVKVKAVKSAVGDASGSNMTCSLKF